jgi:hypothetical protein
MMRSKEKAAVSTDTPQDVLRKLAGEDDELAILVARNPNAGPDLLANIYSRLQSNAYGLTAGCIVLESGLANFELLLRVIADFPDVNEERDVDYPGERSYGVLLAQHKDTPLEVLGQLSESPYYLVREQLALRPDLPKNIATRLASDKSRLVRQVLASNPNLSVAELQMLATDSEPAVRFKVALHPRADLAPGFRTP